MANLNEAPPRWVAATALGALSSAVDLEGALRESHEYHAPLFKHSRVWAPSAPDDSAIEEATTTGGGDGDSRLIGDAGRPPRRDEEPDDDDNEAPETPLDEPSPTPVQDPPAEPDKRPYTVKQCDDVARRVSIVPDFKQTSGAWNRRATVKTRSNIKSAAGRR